MSRIVIIGGGPAGYEAALVAAQLGAEVTVVEAEGAGGACVLHDCVPSKTFIASSDVVTAHRTPRSSGSRADPADDVRVDAPAVHRRVKRLAAAQSGDIHAKLIKAGVEFVTGTARLGEDTLGHTHAVQITPAGGDAPYAIAASTVLIATGATPRVLPTAAPDGERILDWRQVYDLPELPEHLIVVGSGVTGAEFASAYLAMGIDVTLVSSRDRVMPHEDPDAAMAIERVFRARGMTILNNARAAAAPQHRRRGRGRARRRPHRRGLARADGGRLGAANGRRWASRSTASRSPPAATSPSTGCRAPTCPASTPPATAPACCRWPASPPCRAGSRCGTRSARRSRR